MYTLILFGAALICLVAAPFCRSEPSEQEMEDDQSLRSLWLLPGILLAMVAVFFKARNLDDTTSKKSAFPILVCLSLVFIIAGLVATGFSQSGAHK